MDPCERKEHIRMQQPGATCWYCNREKCSLTHKYDNPSEAARPNDNPYSLSHQIMIQKRYK